MILGAIEAGGTKINCAIGNEDGKIYDSIRIDTKSPEKTIAQIIGYFKKNPVEAMGIGSFGPAVVDPLSKDYGLILDTPKQGWENFNFLGALKKYLDIPMVFDTDVNGAALGEYRWGAARQVNSCVYMTVGTGIGGGACIGGELLHGILHPEMGHIPVRIHPEDSFEGICPFHSNCLEGMASGPSMEKRWGKKADLLKPSHMAWDLEAYYLAQGVVNIILLIGPEKIILGGGVMSQGHLLPKIRKNVQLLLNGYLKIGYLENDINTYIVEPMLGKDSGLYGALALASKWENKQLHGVQYEHKKTR
ncbi:MAG: ROK family protein [Tissierellaceae bacterium]